MLDFDPNREAVPAKDAATVLIVRSGASRGVELFFVRRHAKSAFLGGAVVFPGGKLDAGDSAPELHARTNPAHARASSLKFSRKSKKKGGGADSGAVGGAIRGAVHGAVG